MTDRTIPYDYSFQFELEGNQGRLHQKAISVSVEGTFMAVSLGYGAVQKAKPVFVAGATLTAVNLQVLLSKAQEALAGSDINPIQAAFRINPAVEPFLDRPIPSGIQEQLVQIEASGTAAFQFLYAIHDEGTGRAFQNEPVLSTAGLGDPDGERPFRYFAVPVAFAPLTTIRLDVIEAADFQGTLHVTLHGYKTLGEQGTPTSTQRPRRRRS